MQEGDAASLHHLLAHVTSPVPCSPVPGKSVCLLHWAPGLCGRNDGLGPSSGRAPFRHVRPSKVKSCCHFELILRFSEVVPRP